jgi:hypothetical protein
MKKISLYSLGLLLFMLGLKKTNAQNFAFFYVAPTATMNTAFGAAAAQGFVDSGTGNPMMTGYRYVALTPANITQFRGIASPNMLKSYDSITTNTSALRRKLNRIISLAGNKISVLAVFLTDDRTFLPANTPNFFCATPDANSFAWPCASNWKNGNTYIGRVNLGEVAAVQISNDTGGFKNWEGTIIHEFSHTQMLSDTTGVNKWDHPGASVDGISISYGGDDGHWFTELQADEQQPMDEGLATYWALEHNPPMTTDLDAFLNQNSAKFLLGSRSFLTGTPAMWNAPHQVICSGPLPCITSDGRDMGINLNTALTPATGNYELRSYRWLDVPGEFVLYNEQMSMAYFYLFHQYGFHRRDTSYNKIYTAAKTLSNHAIQRYRYPAHVANILANTMEAYARSAAGQAEATSGTLVSSMFAYALYDLLGHFGRSEADLRREFNINSATYIPHTQKPLAYTHYWAHRNQIKQLACQHLGSNNCSPSSTGAINIHQAVAAVRDYFKNPSRILR